MAGLVTKKENRRSRKKKRAQKGVVFGNANAGKNMNRQRLVEEAMKIMREELGRSPTGGSETYVKMHLTRSLEELGEAKEQVMREDPPDFAIIFGGDGTAQKVVGEDEPFLRFLTSDGACEFVVFGTGTERVLPRALGLLGNDDASQLARFRVVCQKIARGIPRRIEPCPLLRINERHGFIYASGLAVNVLDMHYEHDAGPRRNLKTGAALMWSETLGRLSPWRRPSIFRRFGAEVTSRDASGVEASVDMPCFNSIIASSLPEINSLLKVTHRAGERLSCFHGVCYENGLVRTLANLPGLAFGGPLLGSVVEVLTDRMVIRYTEPMRHTIDGEIYKSTSELGCVVDSETGEEVVVIETGPYIKFVRG